MVSGRDNETLVRDKLSNHFANNKESWQTVAYYVNEARRTSCILKYFVTEYAKYNGVQLSRPDRELFFVYPRFKAEQQGYGQRLFGPRSWWPIRGSHRECFSYHDIDICSTLGELHFWYWCVTNGVTDYIEQNLDGILAFRNDSLAAYGFEN